MKRIKLLSKTTYDKIAAGEVVERPASIVKELVENSIDAGAKNIDIEIYEGGIKQIRITDDGSGIYSEDVELAFIPHATSKIENIDDLYAIKSLGFRGEALASISAVSQLEMLTKTKDELLGTKISIWGGEIKQKNEIAIKTGTTIYVNNLFYNVPVRLKFLRKPKTEESEITDLVEKLMLSNPSIAFRYFINGKLIYQTTGSTLFDVIYTIYGDTAKSLIEVSYSRNGYEIHGYISKPENCKANRTYQTLFINGRVVISPLISSAIQNAYENFMMKGKFPFYILHLNVPSDTIDVNVHPNKKEVKFEDTNKIFGLFNSVIYKYLYESDHILDIKSDNLINATSNREEKEEKKELINSINNTENSSYKLDDNIFTNLNKDASKLVLRSSEPMDTIEEVFLDDEEATQKDTEKKKDEYAINDNIESKKKIEEQLIIENVFNSFNIVGTFFSTYIIIEKDENIFIIDQHAAHERQIYDKLKNSVNNSEVIAQDLLEPYLLEVNEVEKTFILNNLPFLKRYGFSIEEFGRKTLKVNAIPYILNITSLREFFNSILEDCDRLTKKPTEYINEFFTQKACKAAIKAGKSLTEDEIKILLTSFSSNNVLLCPHGRPIVIKLTKKEIEKLFKRIE